jgi:hypothetical protein
MNQETASKDRLDNQTSRWRLGCKLVLTGAQRTKFQHSLCGIFGCGASSFDEGTYMDYGSESRFKSGAYILHMKY